METYGGAERVTAEMARVFPGAPVVALAGRAPVAARMGIEGRYRTLLPEHPSVLRYYRTLTPVYPLLASMARLPEADVLLSSSYGFAHHMRTPNRAPHVCYCHSPLRFAWSMTSEYRARWAGRWPAGPAFELLARAMRSSDRRSVRRITHYLTQSPFIAEQIECCYGRQAEVIGAPVDCALFHPTDRTFEDYYLVCGRLIEPYKRVSVVLEAFRRLPHRLVVAGDGPASAQLRAMAPPNVEFTGQLGDDALVPLMQRCRAAIFPSRDDFGLLPVEVMACGRPVLAYGQGGALHTVVSGLSGELFSHQTPAAVHAAVSSFRPESYDPAKIRAHAQRWDRHLFASRLVAAVEKAARNSTAAASSG
jgi:glycosyltransferase involved in cell wall biosynthesis